MVDIAMLEDQQRVAQIMGKSDDNADADALRELIPAYARLQVPLCDKGSLKECAALLRSLSEEMRILADRNDVSQTRVLYRAWGLVKSANSRMQEATRYRNEN